MFKVVGVSSHLVRRNFLENGLLDNFLTLQVSFYLQLIFSPTMTALAVDETNIKELLANADTLSNSGQPAEALAIYNAVLAKFSNYNDVSSFHAAVGSCHFQLKDVSAALISFKHAGELDPTNTAATTNAGALSKETGDFDAAVQWYQLTLKHTPNNFNCSISLAVVYLGSSKCKNFCSCSFFFFFFCFFCFFCFFFFYTRTEFFRQFEVNQRC